MKIFFAAFLLLAASLVAAFSCTDNEYRGVCVIADARSDPVDLAAKYVGRLRYVLGGESLETGADCSGFVQQIYLNAGRVSLPRTAAQQFNVGTPVARAGLQAGDLVFFRGTNPSKPKGEITHVGIFLSDCAFIHAPHSGTKVSYGNLCSAYNIGHYAGAKRV